MFDMVTLDSLYINTALYDSFQGRIGNIGKLGRMDRIDKMGKLGSHVDIMELPACI